MDTNCRNYNNAVHNLVLEVYKFFKLLWVNAEIECYTRNCTSLMVFLSTQLSRCLPADVGFLCHKTAFIGDTTNVLGKQKWQKTCMHNTRRRINTGMDIHRGLFEILFWTVFARKLFLFKFLSNLNTSIERYEEEPVRFFLVMPLIYKNRQILSGR
jgi:hypothetical protein